MCIFPLVLSQAHSVSSNLLVNSTRAMSRALEQATGGGAPQPAEKYRRRSAQGKAPANDTISPQMLPATFVVNNDGREACFCPLPEDTDGLYVLFFNQGTFHGSKKISTALLSSAKPSCCQCCSSQRTCRTQF